MPYENLVRAVLSNASTWTFTKAAAPYRVPPQEGVVLLIDSEQHLQKAEYIAYTGLTDNGSSFTLTGVERAQEGSAQETWAPGAILLQAVPAGLINELEEQVSEGASTGPTIQWSTETIYITQPMTGTITNYDTLTGYTVSAALGTVSIDGDTLTYTAPTTAGAETLTINGRTLDFPVQPAGINTPTLVVPSNGSTGQGSSVELVASAYATTPAGFEAHTSSDWQVATDSGFTNIVAQSLDDTVNLESWTADGLVESTLYYWRVRYKSASLVSAWMTSAQFTTADTFAGVIGTAGQQGFGAGVYPGDDLAAAGLTEMTGTTDPAHDNYGNYQHSNGSIMVFVPKFYYRVGNAAAPQYATYGANSIEIAGIDQFSDTASASAADYVLHRAFIDGGNEKSGFFIDKYLNSKSVDGVTAVSVKNQSPISLTTNNGYNPSSTMTGCTGILNDAVVLGRARGSQYNQSSAFMFGALAILSLAHGQVATGTAACAWYDASSTTNFPKGCNSSLSDVNDSGVTFTTAGDSGAADKPLAGSGVPFAKTTHNGQNCGVADLNGSLFDCALGITAPGTSTTSTTPLSNDTIYVLKESVALASLTAGWDGSTDAWGNTTHLNTLYDSVTSPHALGSTTGVVYWGSGSNQVIDGAGSGVAWSTAGFIPKDNNATSATGTNQFGNDYLNRYNRHNMFPLVGGFWTNAASAGVFYRDFYSRKSIGSYYAAPRASAYLQ